MSETLRVQQANPASEEDQKYFSFQIRGWTSFDPMNKTLARIAEEIEEGGGFLTVVEILKTGNNLASIDDEEVRECFENMRAAKRLIQNAPDLPKRLFDELRSVLQDDKYVVREPRSALQDEMRAVPKKTVTPAATSSSVSDKSGTRDRPWP